MGTFMGHFLPGCFFFCFSVWWCIRIFQSYFYEKFHVGHSTSADRRSSSSRRGRFRNSFLHPMLCCCGRVSGVYIEAGLVLFTTGVGITGEIITGMKENGFILGNAQHITMFFSFALVGLASVLEHRRLPMMIDGTVNALAVVALVSEAVLFNYHVHGRNPFDKHLHYLLVYTVAASAVAVIAERIYVHSHLTGLVRTFCFMLQGSWLVQIGYILYCPVPGSGAWDVSEAEVGESIMIATLYFSWHMLAICIGMAVIGLCVQLCCRTNPSSSNPSGYESMRSPLIQTGGSQNGLHQRMNVEDSDSDVDEFSKV